MIYVKAHIVANMAAAAAAITAAVIQPRTFKAVEFACLPITFVELVSMTTSTINGGANTPLSTADQNNILTASMPT